MASGGWHGPARPLARLEQTFKAGRWWAGDGLTGAEKSFGKEGRRKVADEFSLMLFLYTPPGFWLPISQRLGSLDRFEGARWLGYNPAAIGGFRELASCCGK